MDFNFLSNFSLEDLQGNGAGFSAAEETAKSIEMIDMSVKMFTEQTLHSLTENGVRMNLMGQRAITFIEAGILSDEEGGLILKRSSDGEKLYVEARNKVEKTLDGLNDRISEMVQNSTRGLENLLKEGFQNHLEVSKEAEKAAKKIQETADKVLGDATKKLKAAQDRVAEIERQPETPARDAELLEAKRAAATAQEESTKATKALADAATATEKAGQVVKEFTDALNKTAFKKVMSSFDTFLKNTVIDISKATDGLKKFGATMKEAADLLTKGYKIYFKRMAQGSETVSLFWGEAVKAIDDVTEIEVKRYKGELARLEGIVDEDEFIVKAAKFLTPTSKMWLNTQEEFVGIWESENYRLFKLGEFFVAGVKAGARVSLAASVKALEVVLGERIAAAFAIAATGVGELILPVSEFFLVTIPLIKAAWNLVIDLFKDGMTWKFVDEALKYFYLSLDMFETTFQRLKEYPELSKTVPGSKVSTHIDLMRYDSVELSTVIDFWGAQYIKWMKIKGHSLPAYQKLKPFRALSRIPGRYIDTTANRHPLDTESEIQECRELEQMVAMNNKKMSGSYYSSSQVDSWFPKSDKKGWIRNLASFPVYNKTMQWPDKDQGETVQTHGYFSKNDLDPTIVQLFIEMATSGKYGPVYNKGKTKEIRDAGVEANKKDLAAWLDPKKEDPFAWLFVRDWLQGLRGKQGIMLHDMIHLGPDMFQKEWSKDLPTPQKSEGLWPWNKQDTLTYQKRMTDVAYEERHKQLGRYTFHPMDRNFLNDIVDKNKIYRLLQFWPGNPPRGGVEVFFNPTTIEYGNYTKWEKPTKAERDKYTRIRQEGLDFQALLQRDKAAAQLIWDNQTSLIVWDDYVRVEKPVRTVWSYVKKFQTDFITEIMLICNVLAMDKRSEAWADYIKLITKSHVPLHMDSVHRSTFMGMFASLAYSENTKDAGYFMDQISKRFGGKPLVNQLVTTDPAWNGKNWAWDIEKAFIGVPGIVDDLLQIFGNINARVFVLNKPRVVVIAFAGETVASEWKLGLDFTKGKFSSLNAQQKKNSFEIIVEPDGSTKSSVTLTTDKKTFMVHDGFLRVSKVLQPELVKLLNAIYKKYKPTDVFMTGHGVGAAIVQIMALMIPRLPVDMTRPKLQAGGGTTSKYKNPNCYMFGSPTIGDERFVSTFSTWSGESVQIWIDGDTISLMPPFLLPDKKQSIVAWNDSISSLRVIAGKGGGLAGLLYLEHILVPLLHLPKELDLGNLFDDYKTFNKKKLGAMAKEIWKASNANRSLRGGSVFFRMNGLTRHGFHETTFDSGNSQSSFYAVSTASNIIADNTEKHKLVNIVNLLAKMADEHPDLFKIDAEDLPSWATGGDIAPDDPDDPSDPDTPEGRIVDRDIADQLMKGEAKIVGYAKSKHWHKPWSIVPNTDVESKRGVWMSDKSRDIISGLSHQGSQKRRKIDKHDHTYRGSDYM